jgi:hypothetical protein
MKSIIQILPFTIQITALLFIVSCDSERSTHINKDGTDSVRIIINPKNVSKISFFDHFSEIELIPLETTPESLIEDFDKVIFHSGVFYILDLKQTTLFLFNDKGEYIDKISRKGKGPGEYVDLYDFNINEFTGNLELLDPWSRLLIFSPELEYIETMEIDQRIVHQFFNLNKDTIAFYAFSEDEKLSFFSRSQGKIFHKVFKFEELEQLNLFPGTGSNNAFHRFKDKILFSVPYSYEVLDITNAQLDSYRKMDFGNYNFKPENIETGKDLFYHASYYKNLKNEVIHIRYFYETDNHIYSMFVFNSNFFSLTFNKTDYSYDIVDRYQEGIGAVDIYTNIEDGSFFRVMNLTPKYLDAYMNILTEEQKKLVATITPEDNPGLVKYKIKKQPHYK